MIVSLPLHAYGANDITISEKLEFGAALEEALGHFRALEMNLDEGDTELAITHATHPIAELYDVIKPTLAAADPSLDAEFGMVLEDLKHKASTTVPRAQAQSAIENAKNLVEESRMAVIGADISANATFKLMLMSTLLETSIAEYAEAVENGRITEMAEFQDGSAFVWRAEQILMTIEDDLDHHDYDEFVEYFGEINEAYEMLLDPSEVDERTSHLLADINAITGMTDEASLLGYVDTINQLLEDARVAYAAGNSDLALSQVTKAYLDNYEFLERPLVDAGERELMERVEVMLREELRSMIRQGAPVSQVNAQIDAILMEMDTVAVIVPEFGAMVAIVLAVAVVSVLVLTRYSRLSGSLMRPGL